MVRPTAPPSSSLPAIVAAAGPRGGRRGARGRLSRCRPRPRRVRERWRGRSASGTAGWAPRVPADRTAGCGPPPGRRIVERWSWAGVHATAARPCSTAWPSVRRLHNVAGRASSPRRRAWAIDTEWGVSQQGRAASGARNTPLATRRRLPRSPERSVSLFRGRLADRSLPTGSWQGDARERFEEADDFTVAVEEEFALLDPASLDLVNRFEDVQAAAQGTPLAANLAGELIASEVEIKTGKCADVAAAIARCRAPRGAARARRRPRPRARRERHAPVGRLEGPADHRHAALPPQQRRSSTTSSGATTPSASTSTSGSSGADRALAVNDALRGFLPELLALSAGSPLVEGVNSGLHSARTQIFTRFFPRCGVPDAFRLDAVRGLRPLPLRHGLRRRAHPAVVERAAASRLPDGRDPHLRRPARRRRRPGPRRRSPWRSPRASRGRSTRASRCPCCRTG